MSWQRYRTVIENKDVEAAVNLESNNRLRFVDAWLALQWLLSRDADNIGITRSVIGRKFRLYKQAGDPVADTPDISVVYDTTDDQVIIYGINVQERQA